MSRSRFLGNIKSAFDKNPALDNLLIDEFFRDAIHKAQVVMYRAQSVLLDIPWPAINLFLQYISAILISTGFWNFSSSKFFVCFSGSLASRCVAGSADRCAHALLLHRSRLLRRLPEQHAPRQPPPGAGRKFSYTKRRTFISMQRDFNF